MDENEQLIEDVIEEVDSEETTTEEPQDTKEEPKVEKQKETPEAKQARLTRELKQLNKKLGVKEESVPSKQKTSGLDEAQLDYLDLKGYSDDDEIAVIQSVVEKTGLSVRDALKDEYVQSKLASLKAAREVKDATPSSTRRSTGASADSVAAAVAKFEKSGIMPDDFDMKIKVIDALAAKTNTNKPSWH